ncbi:MAG: hypothetical protein MRY83_00990 [Flavobacteriales bacterium]|nr:hypothetical protein [Flavobacteriales bacterium]
METMKRESGLAILFSILFIILLVLITNTTSASSPPQTLSLECQVTYFGKKKPGIHLSLYEENQIKNESTSNAKGKVKFNLEPGKYYTILVTEEGFSDKKIQINTTDVENFKKVKDVHVELGMVMQSDLGGNNYHDDLDYPFAVFELNKEKHCFQYDAEYALAMQELEYNEQMRLLAQKYRKIISRRKIANF